MKGTNKLRAKTLWPYIASVLSIVSGVVLAWVAYIQISFFSGFTQAIGYWNAFVTLAYLVLAILLLLRRESAYTIGLTLSLGNIGFVTLQTWFLVAIEKVTGIPLSEEESIVFFAFLGTDLLLYGSVYLSFKALIPPLRPQDVPDSPLLLTELKNAKINRKEKDQLLRIRREFIAYMHEKFRGNIEINSHSNNQHVDIVAKPFRSYMFFLGGGGSSHKRYQFHAETDYDQVRSAKGVVDCIITIFASNDAFDESERGLTKISVYSLRDELKTGRQESDFVNFAIMDLGIFFGHYERSLRKPEKVNEVEEIWEEQSYPLPEDMIECPQCGKYAPMNALICPRCRLDFYPSDNKNI